ncbi:ATPase, T2SS/T4P/T4SS family [Xanthomonas arboricola]|uniref:Defect-in-organelle-trafficking protein DotB n=1 Tax=Xanthomonas arboricola TaxID=56448 RepID=A0AB73H3Z2_9XANT|nr:ATPase, T2SS/T4P/T4SS family [Xanthomonas arboricola]MBB5672611.1 defect-in-organelle-trafficking protein DotB [Xanthomonas arboricola]
MTVSSDYFLSEEPSRFGRDEFNALLVYAKKIGASDIHLQSGSRVLMRVHGDMQPITRRRIDESEMSEICRVLYDGDNGELELRTGKPLDNAYSLKLNRDSSLRFRWNATGCEIRGGFGIKFTLRELPEMPPELPVADLGSAIVDALYPDEGLILVCGATGSGKSTLLAGTIRNRLEDPDAHENILEASAPIEFVYTKVLQHPNCTSTISQSSVPGHLPSFAAAIPNFLRCDPDRIIIGESRDAATIKASTLAAQTGHALYSTVHANSVPGVFLRLMQSLPSEEVASELGSVIEASRLIICQKLYRSPLGGRVAVRESLVLDKDIRKEILVAAARSLAELPNALTGIVKEAGTPMWRHAETLASQGRLDPVYADLMKAEAGATNQVARLTYDEILARNQAMQSYLHRRLATADESELQEIQGLLGSIAEKTRSEVEHAAA